MKSLIFLFLLIIARSQVLLGAGEQLQVPCSSQGHILYFKTMKEFSVISLTKVDSVTLTSSHATCSFGGNISSICTFENFTQQLNVTCLGSTVQQLHLSIQKPNIIQNKEELNSTFIVVPLEESEEAILSLMIDEIIAEDINRLKDEWKNTIFHSDCLINMVPFQQTIKIALRKKQSACTIGTINTHQWQLDKTILNAQHPNVHSYRGYLQTNISKIYTMPDSPNITIQLIIQTQNQKQMDNMKINISTLDAHNVVENFTITNFQEGFQSFQAIIYFNKPIQQMTIVSQYDVFYSIYFKKQQTNKLTVIEDQYLFLHLTKNKSTQFVVGLQTFEDQKDHMRELYFHEQFEYPVKFQQYECTTPDCHNFTKLQSTATPNSIKQESKVIPKCQHMYKDRCYLKIVVTSQKDGYFGVIALAYSKDHELQPNKIHTGVYEKEKVYHYVVKKSHMLNSTSEIVRVHVSGAKAYLTYNQNCKRISCAQHWDTSGNIEFPKQDKDLFMFLVGTGKDHYTLYVSTQNQTHFQIPEGLMLPGRLSINQNHKYFTYKPLDASKSFEIVCNALPGTVLLLANVRSNTFPNKANSAYSSKDCYLFISPKQYSQDDKIHITIQRVTKQNRHINFQIYGLTEGSPLSLPWNQPHYDYFQPQSTKIIKYLLNTASKNVINYKIDVLDQSFSKPVIVQIVGLQNNLELYSRTISDVETFILTSKDQQQICKTQEIDNCSLIFRIINPGKYGVQASLTIWHKRNPLKLPIGQYTNFPTGSLGEQMLFYIPVHDKSKPFNVYIYSTTVQIQAIGALLEQDISKAGSSKYWPYPMFNKLTQEQSDMLSYSFSSSLYFSNDSLQKATNNSAILLTVRDRSTFNNKSLESLAVVGFMQIAVSNGFLKLRENDKFQYSLKKQQTQYFAFPLSGHHLQNPKLEVYFHNQQISGKSKIAFFFNTDHSDNEHTIFQPTDFVSINLASYKHKHNFTKDSEVSLIFAVKTEDDMSKFIATISTSTTNYRQLTLGIPQQFYLPQHSSVIFEFSDFYNEDFKIKMNRQEGFPEYKIVSCKTGQNKMNCLKTLTTKQNKTSDAQNSLVVSTKSHELKIDSKSQYYCKDCTYYIAFYSHSHQIFGSLTVTRPGQGVLLKESSPITTQIDTTDSDTYLISSLPTSTRLISIVPHMGHLKVELKQISSEGQKVVKIQNSTDGSSINIHIEKSLVIPYQVTVSSLDQQNAMYTIILSSTSKVIKLVKGIPFKATFKAESALTLSFQPEGNSSVLLSATGVIDIDLTCQSNQSTLVTRNKNIKHSQIFNTSLIQLSSSQCETYEIEISNTKPLKITVLANSQDIVLLPFNLPIPAFIKKGESQIYEIPIQQKTHLKIVMKLCQAGHSYVYIAANKNKLQKQKYNATYEIVGDRMMEIFDYPASPGVIYIEIQSSTQDLEFMLEVFPIQRQSVERSIPKTMLNDAYIETVQTSPGRYNIEFEPFVILQDEVNYNVSYVLVQSNQRSYLKKTLRCSGSFFDVKNPNTQFTQTTLKVEKLSDGSLRAPYTSTQQKSYIAILPVVTPPLPPFTHMVAYQISQLSGGKGPQLIQRMISKMLGIIEAITGIQDQNMLNFTLILSIIIFNIFLITICCWISARHCRKTVFIERKRLATSQRQGRLMRVQNSLDMLQEPIQQSQRELP